MSAILKLNFTVSGWNSSPTKLVNPQLISWLVSLCNKFPRVMNRAHSNRMLDGVVIECSDIRIVNDTGKMLYKKGPTTTV